VNRKIITTADGSTSLYVPHLNESYHSRNGAVTESAHVYIQAGLVPLLHHHKTLRILEVGFGTGLNAWLTQQQAVAHNQPVFYQAIEPHPLMPDEVQQLNYAHQEDRPVFSHLHTTPWEMDVVVHPHFTLHKRQTTLEHFTCNSLFRLVYFDAFAPDVQPELWTEPMFEKLYSCMEMGGVLVTYSSKGSVRRAMQAAGFTVEKIPGPSGKREMVRATK
jgi:tRNA U34 5-methylaminomethyl-2-thiouridine-forming methyltransferase MnmC